MNNVSNVGWVTLMYRNFNGHHRRLILKQTNKYAITLYIIHGCHTVCDPLSFYDQRVDKVDYELIGEGVGSQE